jgi:hypothetical protein
MELDITRPSQHQQIFPHSINSIPKDEIETPRFQGSITTLTLSWNKLELHDFRV